MKQRLLLVLLCLLMLLCLSLAGCGHSPVGKYVSDKNSAVTLELKSDRI